MLIPLLLLSQSLFVKTPVGDIYQAINDLPPGSCILNGTEELVFEATNINQCNEILLAPGCYRAELRGGMGQKNKNCADHATQDNIQTVSAVFSIPESTTIYALRGGDGNAGDANLYKSQIGTIGGGASGVDSILVVGDRVWRAIGGVGAICAVAIPTNINGTGAAGYGNGFGGNTSGTSTLNTASHMYYGNGSSIYATGSGGGGAPNGTSNKTTYTFNNSGKLPNDIIILAGQDGTSNSGGNGGDVTSCTTVTCDETITIQGGTGGQNTYYSCGGHSAVSYGGGGGGASIKTTSASPFYYPIAGGNGGSGSTDTSSVSFLRIYKM